MASSATMPLSDQSISRRELLLRAAWGGYGLLTCGLAGAAQARTPESAGAVVRRAPWARLEKIDDGVWTVVSSPLASDDWRTGCNGGLIAGRQRVLAIEGFLRPEGSAWLLDCAHHLTGRPVSDVVVTHFHGDHCNGLHGYGTEGSAPRVWMTDKTRDLILDAEAKQAAEANPLREEMVRSSQSIAPSSTTSLDLGGRVVSIRPLSGHTPSDVVVEPDGSSVVFCGDLAWNGFFPNYRDTIPTAFAESVRSLRRSEASLFVTGHGELARAEDLDHLLAIVDGLGDLARHGFAAGRSVEETAADYALPSESADWHLFNPKYFEVAVRAWYRELADSETR